MITIRAYRAIDEKDTCAEYMQGHIKVLHDYGIVNVTSNNPEWPDNPHVYCVIARDETGEMVGGIRVQIANGIQPLPVEIAVGENDPRIYEFVKRLAIDGGIGELSGLWNSKKVKGMGISFILTRAGVAITNQTGIQTLTGICGGYTLEMFSRVGFVTNEALGNNGEFLYPNKDNIARVIGILNSLKLDTAHPEEKEEILSLRDNPIQVQKNKGTNRDLELSFNLLIPNISPINLPEEYIKGPVHQ